jgi:hypothetical protein
MHLEITKSKPLEAPVIMLVLLIAESLVLVS